MWVDADQLAQFYPELLQPKNIQDIEQVKAESEENNKRFDYLKERTNSLLTKNAGWLSANWLKYLKWADTLLSAVTEYKRKWVVWGASDYDIMNYAVEQNPELKKIQDKYKGKKDNDSDDKSD